MHTSDFRCTVWRKSSYSSPDGGNCVEWAPAVAAACGLVPVRDGKNPNGPALAISMDAWTAFVDEVKSGGRASLLAE
ncbi:DUF397 domain-containing protein [Streptomyces sp. NPDC050610]|uniref:DUF397 domain-containing protein n=1 Tax=Streptomyces sp. NPDC050610 TaxID=3157097 RepID=UPI0034170758